VRLKVALIVPARQLRDKPLRKTVCPPLAPAVLAALTPPGVEVSITDENIAIIDFNQDVDLVGITVLTATANRAYDIADAFRSKGIKVVLGGIHASILPDEAGAHADAVVIGEAEGLWPNLIEDLKAGTLQKTYRHRQRPVLEGLPIPRRDLFTKGAYLIPNTISTTRGCPHDCSFCSVSLFFGRTYRCRPIADVIKEIQTLDHKKPIIFVDDNIVGKPAYARELFRALIPYKLKWVGQASVNIARDKELLRLAAASGCVGLLIGFESISPASLAAIGKRINAVDEYKSVIRKLHDHHIAIHGAFIFGLDEDDENIIENTLRFAQETRLESVQFSIVIPHPGTALYKSLDKAGRINSKDWFDYDNGIVFTPKCISPERLREGTAWALLEFFSLPSILRRIGIFRRRVAVWWLLNLIFRAHFRHAKRDKEKLARQPELVPNTSQVTS